MTRAKNNLTIHLNSRYLDNLKAENLLRIENRETHQPPQELAMHLTHRDVWLSYFENNQNQISKLINGDDLIIAEDGCFDKERRSILKYSRHFAEQIENKKKNNYRLKSAKVNFILYWKNEELDKEVKIVLPELFFERDKET